jgi:hypothetical protein
MVSRIPKSGRFRDSGRRIRASMGQFERCGGARGRPVVLSRARGRP